MLVEIIARSKANENKPQVTMTRGYLIVLVMLLGLTYSGYSQNFNEARNYFTELEEQINTAKDDTLLMSYPALNIFFAKKVNTYLTGSSDLSINKSYFIVEPSDGRLFLGYNWAKDPSKTKKRTSFVTTFGIETDVSDEFSTIYIGSDNQVSSNIGGVVKFTWLAGGSIKYGKNNVQVQQKNSLKKYGLDTDSYSQQEVASNYRARIRNEINEEIREDSVRFTNSLQQVGGSAYRAFEKRQFYQSGNKKYKREFITREANSVARESYYNSYNYSWVSIKLYLPFTYQRFEVTPDLTSSPVYTYKFYNFDGSVLFNHLYERKKLRLIGSLGLGAEVTNNLGTTVPQYTVTDYLELANPNNTTLAEIESEELYVGEYDEYINRYARAQVVGFFIANKQIGLSFQAEKYFNIYNPLNVEVGIPFTLQGEDDNTKASFEIQAKFNDLNNDINSDETWREKFTVGVSIGVPLTSQVY